MDPRRVLNVVRLPARLDVTETANLLGFAEHDVQILMAARKLIPLGEPAPNAPKWFAAIEIVQLATDKDWLNKATKEVARYWRKKRERRENSIAASFQPYESFGKGEP